jgi:hypothetical protein
LPKRTASKDGGKSSTHRTISCKDPCKQAMGSVKSSKGRDGSKATAPDACVSLLPSDVEQAFPMASIKFKSSFFVDDSIKCFISTSLKIQRRGCWSLASSLDPISDMFVKCTNQSMFPLMGFRSLVSPENGEFMFCRGWNVELMTALSNGLDTSTRLSGSRCPLGREGLRFWINYLACAHSDSILTAQ